MIRCIETPFLKVLLGCNLYSRQPLIRLDLEVDAGVAGRVEQAGACVAEWASAPALPSSDVFELVGALAAWLQADCGHGVTEFSPSTRIGLGETVLFPWEDSTTGLAAGELAVDLVAAALAGNTPDDLGDRLQGFRRQARARCLNAVQRAMLAIAEERDIPVLRLHQAPFVPPEQPPVTGELLQFGWGCKQIRCQGLLSEKVDQQAMLRAMDRDALCNHLEEGGVPVPRRDRTSPQLTSLRRARRAAQAVGYPVVVKPADARGGAGITLNVDTEDALIAAVNTARQVSPRLVVEQMLPGDEYRVIVIHARAVAVIGRHADAYVDATRDLSSALQNMAVHAAEHAGLNVAAVDMLTVNASGNEAHILGLDPDPALDMLSRAGVAEPVARAFLEALVPEPDAVRIPTVAVTGTNGKTTSCRMLAHILRSSGLVTGLATTDGIKIDDEWLHRGDLAGAQAAFELFQDRRVQAGVMEFARGGLIKQGVGLPRVDVAGCTNLTGDHVGQDYVNTDDDMARVKGQAMRAAWDIVVLNADDVSRTAFDEFIVARTRYLVTMNADPAALLGEAEQVFHITEDDGREVITRTSADGSETIVPVADIPATLNGCVRHNAINATWAAALAAAMGHDTQTIAEALKRFHASREMNPGRFNVHETQGFTVIEDYGHNADGYRRIGAAVGELFPAGRKIAVLQLNGNRPNALLQRAVRTIAPYFDEYVCSELVNLRREVHGEVMTLIRDALVESGVSPDRVRLVLDPDEAVRTALGMARKGDVVAVMGRKDPEAWAIITAWPEEQRPATTAGTTDPDNVLSF